MGTRERGLAQCPAQHHGQGSPAPPANSHSPSSFYLLSLTSYTPQSTDMNLLRTAAQMLAMWTKGPWERGGGRGVRGRGPDGGLGGILGQTLVAPGTVPGAGNTDVSKIEVLPSQSFIPGRKGGDTPAYYHFRKCPPLATTRESPRSATKTQRSHKCIYTYIHKFVSKKGETKKMLGAKKKLREGQRRERQES